MMNGPKIINKVRKKSCHQGIQVQPKSRKKALASSNISCI